MTRGIQSLFLALAVTIFATVSADGAEDLEAFKAAYAAYQKYEESDDYERAMPEAKAAYEIGLRVFGEEHENTAVLAYNYGLILVEIRSEKEAKEVLREAVRLYESVYGKGSVELIPVLMDLGDASAEVFEPAKQTKYYNRALKLARDHYGPASARYGNLLLDTGIELLNRAQSPKARMYLQDGYQILRDALGEEDIRTGYAAFQLARYEVARKRYSNAEGHLQAALKTFEDPDRPSTLIEMSTHAWLVTVYEELGDSDKATAHCQAIGRMTPNKENQDYLPLYRKAPRYPTIAQQRGLEGFVDVEFTVDHEGIVHDPVVIEVNGHSSFVARSVEAVKGFRYAPRFVDGQPVETQNVQTRMTFQFTD